MDKKLMIQTIQAVVNTLNAATLRADQVDAVQRINACTQELRGVIAVLESETKNETTEG